MGFSLSVIDRVLAQFIISGSAGTSADVLPAKASLEKEPPATICYCHTATPDPEFPYSGNFMVDAYVETRQRGIIEAGESDDTPRTKAEDRADKTFALFRVGEGQSGDALGDAITAARGGESVTIQSAKIKEITQGFNPVHPNRNLGNIWVDCIHLELLVTPGNTA